MDGFRERYRSLGFVFLCVLLLAIAFYMLLPFFPAILWASVLTVLMWPLHLRFRRNRSPNAGAGITTFVTLAIVGVPLFLIGLMLFFQVNSFLSDIRSAAPVGQQGLSVDFLVGELDAALKPLFDRIAPDFSLVEWYGLNKDQVIRSLSGPAGKIAISAGYTAFTLVIAFLTLFFMLRDAERLKQPALELIPLPRESGERMLSRIAATIRAVFVGIVLVAIIQGSIAGLTYYLVGIPHALLWGVATIVLCMIPLLGAPILYIPMGLMLISQGKYTEALVLYGVGFLIVSQIDNILRPFIIGARVELHPMAVFFSLLGGIFLMGPVGIMAGPMILAIALVIVDVLRERNKTNVEAKAEPTPP